jgi:hypothetical protein
MMDLLAEIKQLQGLEEKKRKNLLPRAILIMATIALVVVMVVRFQYKYEKAERNEVSHLQPAVLTKKLSDSSGQAQAAVRTAENSKRNVLDRPEAPAETAAAASPESADRTDALRPGTPEQPDLEKAIDMLMKRRSPKY